MNGGQVCLCPEIVFVPRESVQEFIDVATEQARVISTADSGNVSIVNDANFNRLASVLDDARSRGAMIHETVPGASPDSSTRRIQPLIVTGFDDSMMISHEELFGPILMVRPYDSIDEVIDYLAPRPSPLAAYWFGPKDKNFDAFTRKSRYGGMTVNDVGLHAAMPILPFGGVGQSGSGGYHGRHGFETFTHARPVTTSRLPISMGVLATPPIGRRATQSIDSALGRAARGARRRLGRR
jgi:coniferyl-aldehyde dehydrogenase